MVLGGDGLGEDGHSNEIFVPFCHRATDAETIAMIVMKYIK